jgi:hypothetical protein
MPVSPSLYGKPIWGTDPVRLGGRLGRIPRATAWAAERSQTG